MYRGSIVSIDLVLMSDIEFEVVSYNINAIGDDRKMPKIFNSFKKQTSNKSVIFIEESNTKRFEYLWRGKLLFSHETLNSTGVCI